MKKLVVLFVFVSIGLSASAQQDRHFSMAFASPVLRNPGAAGHGMGSFQMFANFRTQWFTLSAQPFRSFAASFDAKILQGSLNNGYIGLGVNMINDVSGDGKFTVNVIQVPLNYTLEVSKNHFIGIGLSPGLYAQKINEGALYFDNQWSGTGFNQNISSGEDLGAFNLSKFDLGAGVYYDAILNDNLKLQAGLSALHLTAQEVSFYQTAEKLYRNFSFYAAADIWNSNSNLSYHPALYGQVQGPNFEIIAGSNFEYALKPVSKHTGYYDGMALSFGVYYRVGDAFIGNIIYKAGPLSLGVSYDANVSALTTATSGVGAVEVFLKFNPQIKQRFGSPRIH